MGPLDRRLRLGKGVFSVCVCGGRGLHGLTLGNFCFTFLFSMKFLYFFFISSLFPNCNLFLSIFIQYYVNNNLHVSTLYIISTVIVGSDTRDFDIEG